MINLKDMISEADDRELAEVIVHALIVLGQRGSPAAEVLQAYLLDTMGSDKALPLEAGFEALNA